ncbi:PE-PPE domain-containing protein [Gordonia aichiensis]
MYRIRKSVGSAAVGCALCLGTVVPLALSSAAAQAGVPSAEETQATVNGLGADHVFRTAEPDDGAEKDWLTEVLKPGEGELLVVVTPGTDDGSLYPRIKGLRFNDRPTYIIDYPESIGPIISGRSGAVLPFFAPSYDQSRDVAVDKNLTAMKAFATQNGENPFVVYTGYSQGAEALGNAAEQAIAQNGDGTAIDVNKSHILLVSDPRSPWGLKAWVADHAVVAGMMEFFGAESNGARDPGATGDELPVTSVIVVGDPVANFQWVWYRPVSSLLVDAAGFITIHSGLGEQNYGNLIDYGETPTTPKSKDGNTTYVVYTPKHHPLTALAVLVNTRLGIPFDAADVDRWDQVNNAFYPLQAPGVDNAAVDVVESEAAATPPATTSPLTAQSRAVPEKAADTTGRPASPAGASTTAPQVVEQHAGGDDAPTPSTGRHRAPEAVPEAAPAPSTATTASDPQTPQPPAETAPPVQESSPDQSESDDASTGGRHRVTGQGRHAADSGDADSHAVGSGDATGTAPTGTATAAAA